MPGPDAYKGKKKGTSTTTTPPPRTTTTQTTRPKRAVVATADHSDADREKYLKFLRAQEAARQKLLALRKAQEEAKTAREKAAARDKADKVRANAVKERQKHEQMISDAKASGLENDARDQLRVEQAAERAKKARENPGPPVKQAEHVRGRGLDQTGTSIANSDEFAKLASPTTALHGGYMARAGDAASEDTTRIEDIRFLIKTKDGRVVARKPTVEEYNAWLHPAKNDVRSSGSETRNRKGQPVIEGENDNVLRGKHAKLGDLVSVVGTSGPLLVNKDGQTTFTVHEFTKSYRRKGFDPNKAPLIDKVTQYSRPGEYMTIRQYRDYMANLSKSDPAAFAEQQRKLAEAGYMKKWNKTDTYVPGVMDRQTLQAINGFAYDATQLGPQYGRDFNDLLDDFSKEIDQQINSAAADSGGGGGGGGGGGSANPYAVTDPATLNLIAEQTARAVLGRLPTAQEKSDAVKAVSAAESSSGQMTAGAIPTIDPQSEMTEFFRKKAPAESGAHGIAQAFDVFAGLLGAGGGAGSGAGNIDNGNTKIGTD